MQDPTGQNSGGTQQGQGQNPDPANPQQQSPQQQQQGQGQQQGQNPATQQGTEQQDTFPRSYVENLRQENERYRKDRNQYSGVLQSLGMLDDQGNLVPQNRTQTQQQGQQQQDSPSPDPRLSELEQQNQRLQNQLRQRDLVSDAERLAVESGGDPRYAAETARLVDRSGIRFDDNGNPDVIQLQEAVNAVLNRVPVLKAQGQNPNQGQEQQGTQTQQGSGVGGTGSNPPGGNGTVLTPNPWKSESFNLTQQGQLIEQNPALASRLMQEAGINPQQMGVPAQT